MSAVPALRPDPWLRSTYGLRIELTDPNDTPISIQEIAAGLSRLCRFGGHLKEDTFYSVASHSVFVSLLVPQNRLDLRLAALLHDAAEAYMGCDIPAPLKHLFPEAKALEHRWMKRIQKHFGVKLRPGDAELIKRADRVAYLTERRDLCAPARYQAGYWDDPEMKGLSPSILDLKPDASPHEARVRFLGTAYSLGVLPDGGV